MPQTRTGREPFAKYGSYALLMLGVFLLQSSRGTAIGFWGARLDAMPFLVAAIALLDGPYAGGCFGFAAGTLLQLNNLTAEGLNALYLGLFGVLFGLFGLYYLRPVVLSAMGGGLVCLTVRALFRYVFYYLLVFNAGPAMALTQFAGELVMDIPAGILCWLAVRRIHRHFTEENL